LADVEALVEIEQRTNPVPWRSSHIYESVQHQQAIVVEIADTHIIQAYLIGQAERAMKLPMLYTKS